MTVAELIEKLHACPQAAVVKVYEFESDYWDDIHDIRLMPNNEVYLVGLYADTVA